VTCPATARKARAGRWAATRPHRADRWAPRSSRREAPSVAMQAPRMQPLAEKSSAASPSGGGLRVVAAAALVAAARGAQGPELPETEAEDDRRREDDLDESVVLRVHSREGYRGRGRDRRSRASARRVRRAAHLRHRRGAHGSRASLKPPESARIRELAPDADARRPVVASTSHSPSLASGPLRRQDPRQEPSAVVPLAGIRAGGGPSRKVKGRPYRDRPCGACSGSRCHWLRDRPPREPFRP